MTIAINRRAMQLAPLRETFDMIAMLMRDENARNF